MVVVALSGMPGCGSSTTCRLLAKKLGIEYFSMGSWNKGQLKELENRKTSSETQDSIEMWKNRKGKSKGFHNSADEMQKKIASKGNVVIDSKLGIRMLRSFCDISVWLKADFDIRTRRVAGRDGVGIRESERMIREKEGLERDNFLKIYGFDYFDQEKEADIIIDVGDKKPEDIVELILREMKKRKIVK